jgi:hypothetical protein
VGLSVRRLRGRSLGAQQQTAMPVVGFLHSSSPGGYASRVAAFRQGVNEAGYIEVRNVTIEYRWAEGQKPAEAGCCVPRPVPTASVGQEQTSAIQRYEIELAVIEQRQLDPSAHIRDVRLIEDHLGCVLPVVLEFAILAARACSRAHRPLCRGRHGL